jgi:hypothetical protein
MGIQGYGLFLRLLKEGHTSEQMGLKGTGGEVVRWNSRVKLARNFRGLHVDDFSERTILGYSAFFQVFLTHSALKRYLPIVGLTESALAAALAPHNPRETIQQFFALDPKGKLFDFLHARLNQKLQRNLAACRVGTCCDLTCISASVRHIFAHGHLGGTVNEINPNHVARACAIVSDFLLEFMAFDFTSRIAAYYHSAGCARKKVKDSSRPPARTSMRG